jgi:hypothetical protein
MTHTPTPHEIEIKRNPAFIQALLETAKDGFWMPKAAVCRMSTPSTADKIHRCLIVDDNPNNRMISR